MPIPSGFSRRKIRLFHRKPGVPKHMDVHDILHLKNLGSTGRGFPMKEEWTDMYTKTSSLGYIYVKFRKTTTLKQISLLNGPVAPQSFVSTGSGFWLHPKRSLILVKTLPSSMQLFPFIFFYEHCLMFDRKYSQQMNISKNYLSFD